MFNKERRKKNKEQKIKRKFRTVIRNIDKDIRATEKDINESIILAAECKKSERKEHFIKARNNLAINIALRDRYISLKLDFKTAMSMRNSMMRISEFSNSMLALNKSICKISKGFNQDKTMEGIEEANDIIQNTNEELNDMMSTFSSEYSNLAGSMSTIDNKTMDQADKLIDQCMANGGKSTSNNGVDIDLIKKILDEEKK